MQGVCVYLCNVNMCFMYVVDLIYIKIEKKEKVVEKSIRKKKLKSI